VGLSGADIGRIGLMDHFSHVDLPATLNESTMRRLGRIHVAQRKLELTLETPEIAGERPGAAPATTRCSCVLRPAVRSGARPVRKSGTAKTGRSATKAPQDRKRRPFAGPTAGRGRGPAPGKGFTARNAGTLAIRRKPV
jgi:ATP-dependent RNA helicase DeaD